jgi:UrcA family protein
MKNQIYSIAVAVALVIPSLASADVEIEKVEDNKVVVSYNPVEELERQIRRAASEVCGPQRLSNAGSLSEYVTNRACFEEAVIKALAKV